MTVCVAALATWVDEDNVPQPAVILAADRMITSRGATETEYEQLDKTKLMWLDSPDPERPDSQTVALIVSGNLDDLEIIGQNATLEIKEDGVTLISDMAEVYARHHQSYRLKKVERDYLGKYGLTMVEFIEKQQDLRQSFFDRIDNNIRSYQSDIGEVIIAGIDKFGGHIFSVDDDGVYPCTATGFAAIGIGADFAEIEFTSVMYTSYTQWLDAMVIGYFAKKNAERAPGVGSATDLWWILPDGHRYRAPQDKEVTTLEAIYKNRRATEYKLITEGADIIGNLLVKEGFAYAQRVSGDQPGTEGGQVPGDQEEGVSKGPEAGESEG